MLISIDLDKDKIKQVSVLPKPMVELLVNMVKDLENTREKYYGYSYVRTMRNILIGKEDAAIAQYFKCKDYYGIFDSADLETVEVLMDKVVGMKELDVVLTNHGKLYCTHEYHDYLCRKK